MSTPFSFDDAYKDLPPWEIGRPQREMMALVRAGGLQGSVLDVGCGTGENALYMRAQGYEVWGVDAAPAAIVRAREKARQRKLNVRFLVGDALRLSRLARVFSTVIDCGLFHTFSDEERPRFADELARVMQPAGKYYMLCFSEREPTDWGGPRRITQEEIRATFREGWRVDAIRPACFETNIHKQGGQGWLAAIVRA